MPDTTDTTTPPVPPRLIVSHPADEVANTSPGHRRPGTRRRSSDQSASEDYSRQTSAEWVDVDESPPRRRRRRNKRASLRQDQSSRTSSSSTIEKNKTGSELGRFFPRLSRILESNSETITATSRPSTRGSDTRRHRDESQNRVPRHRGDTSSSIHRRPLKHRTGGVSRRTESVLRVNPSMLSVLTSLTGVSDKSSGSNSTVTQYSYDRRGSSSHSSRTPTGRPRRSHLDTDSTMSSHSSRPNVFDFMMPPSEDGHDTQSVVSASSSSHYEPSDADSSEAPGTPSSRSTFPSPTTTSTRSQSVAELRRKYDPNYTSPSISVRSTSHSPDSSVRGAQKQPSVSDVPEDDGEEDAEGEEADDVKPIAQSEVSYGSTRDRSSSRSSRLSRHSADRLRHQEESLRQHTSAYPIHPQQPPHYIDPVYGQHRSHSSSSANSDRAYAYNMAMQQYQWPAHAPIAPIAHQHLSRPPAPDPPDPNQRTLAGYELLAHELASPTSPVKPLYRKFAYLNHRILLHLQDELSELEDHLRHLDEVIAQLDPLQSEGQRTPASRRGEAWHGTELHHRRTLLLGDIFRKTEQYNRAMAAYSSMARETGPAGGDAEVKTYREWMATHTPIHPQETTFLLRSDDIIAPGGNSIESSKEVDGRLGKHAPTTLIYLPIALMLPLLLFSIIPTLGGRLVVTALIAVGAFMVAATTRVRHLLPAREWAICGAAYVLLMSAIAGCIPQYHG